MYATPQIHCKKGLKRSNLTYRYILKLKKNWDWVSVCILLNNGSMKLALCTKIVPFLLHNFSQSCPVDF